MTYDFGCHFTQELGNRFESPTGNWPATAERVTPFLAIAVDDLDVDDGQDDGLRWFEAAREAHRRVTEAGHDHSFDFGFAHYLDMAAGAYEDGTLPVVAAFEAMRGAYEVARRERSVDVDVCFDCAVQACSRLGGAAPAAATA
ncbi:hypothetical protein ACIQAD_35065 [Streptomyces sp. NPDC088551]|uniref:hypothetical protein n=1 Tax=Streptomyces sp. NPDC088551 TaxID=3365863 RepID=UPI0037F762B9